jgi:hypothetical protein
MNYKEFRRQLGKAGLTIKEFAELIKQTPNSITNHAAEGEVPSHLAIIAALMGGMAEAGVDFRATLGQVEYAPSKLRGGATKGKFGGSKQGDLPLPK